MKQKKIKFCFLLVLFSVILLSCATSTWNRAVKRNTIIDYEYYIENYPNGEYVLECKRRVDELYKIPQKVAEKEVNLWLRCMTKEERNIRKTEESYDNKIKELHFNTERAIRNLENEISSGKRKCYKEERECAVWREEKATTWTSKKQVCSKWATNKQTDYECLGYWENRGKEYSVKITQLRVDLAKNNDLLNSEKISESEKQKNVSIELCKKNLKSEHYNYYPEDIYKIFPKAEDLQQ